MEPLKGGVSDADGGESAEKDRVGDGVKCCTKVKEDVDGERTERERERDNLKVYLSYCIRKPSSGAFSYLFL